MDRWDIFFVLVAGYVAVMTLVRLMARRRNQLLQHLQQQIDQQAAKDKKAKKEEVSQEDRDAA